MACPRPVKRWPSTTLKSPCPFRYALLPSGIALSIICLKVYLHCCTVALKSTGRISPISVHLSLSKGKLMSGKEPQIRPVSPLARAIKIYLETHHVTQEQLAAIIGYEPRDIRRWKNG